MKTSELSSDIKSVADVVKQADNLELYGILLGLYEKALDLQNENHELKDQIAQLNRNDALRARIVRHSQTFITLKDDEASIYYCAHCWDSQGKLIQVNTNARSGEFTCPSCNNTGIFDQQAHNEYAASFKPRGPHYL